jgi:hypothetical protein
VDTVIDEDSWPDFASRLLGIIDFTVPRQGDIRATVDWTFATNDIDIYIVPRDNCGLEAFNARTCDFLAISQTTAKPETVRVTALPAGDYDLLVANFGDDTDSLSWQIVLTTFGPVSQAGDTSSHVLGNATDRQVTAAQTRR